MSDPREQLRQRLQEPSSDARQRLRERLAQDDGSDVGAGQAFAESAAIRYVNNVLNVPNVAVNALIRGVTDPVAGAFMPGSDIRERIESSRPNLSDRTLVPTIQDIGAGVRSIPSLLPGGETPSDAFARNREQIESEIGARREARPVASAVGDVAGDVATLITGRRPVANLVRRAEQKLKVPDLFFGSTRTVDPGLQRAWSRVINSQSVRQLARGAGRSVETGLEASILEVLKGDDADPLEAAALAAGGQVVGSALLEGGKGLLSGGPLKAGAKISITAASIAGLWQLGKEATPGGRDRILESIETGYAKVAYALMLGAAASMAGAGRGRSGQFAEDFPRVMDAIAAVPRGISLSIITDIAGMDPEEQGKAESALNNLARDPDYEGRDETERRIIERIRSLEDE